MKIIKKKSKISNNCECSESKVTTAAVTQC